MMNQYPRFAALCHLATAASLLLSASRASAAAIAHPPDANEVFHCAFETAWDVNFDTWPDRWIRKTGSEYPKYVDIQIRDTDDPEATSGRYLQIDLDGSAAAIASPPIRVMSRFSYRLETRLKIEGLKYSEVSLTIDFLNSAGKLVQSEVRKLTSRADGWHTLIIPSIDPADQTIDRAVIGLNVERGSRGDLKGRVCLGDVWLARMPRITVTTNNACNVYRDKNDVVVRCELSGIREKNPEIRFQLLDASSKELHNGSVHLEGRLIVEDTRKVSDIVDGIGNTPAGYEGATEWRPKIPGYGFYSVVVRMLSSDADGSQSDQQREMDRRVIWLAVVPPLPMPAKGDFGWSLPNADDPLTLQELSELLPNVGVNWVKMPVWYSVAQPHRGDDIVRFMEMLHASNIEMVGILDRPPADSEAAQHMKFNGSIADLLAFDPTVWMPSLDPIMSRLSMRLRCWQLGNDHDTSLVGFPNLSQKLNDLRSKLFRFGQEVKLGMAWAWDGSTPAPPEASWEFEQLWPDAALSIDEFEKFVSQPGTKKIQRWVTIDPPPRSDDPAQNTMVDLDRRANELVRKLVAAKEHGIEGIFISQPFDDKGGVMRANGMPGELLLPWRTTAAMLSGAKYLGSVQLPNGSENRNFLRPDGQVVMVVWNDEPTQETLYLGDDVKLIDVWGGATTPEKQKREQVINVGSLPTFVLGLSEPVTRWRMAVRFEEDHVESIFAKPHPNAIYFQNFFRQGVGGTISIVAPQSREDVQPDEATGDEGHNLELDRWSIDPPQGTFTLSTNEESKFPFEIRLKNAIFGEQPMRVDFVIDADEHYQFSVYRTMWVGTGDVTIEMKTQLDRDGTLVVRQTLTNSSEQPVDFKCYLYAKGYRRQRAQVYRLGSTPDHKAYRYPDGASLIGKELLLEAEEIGGERVLKYRFTATNEPPVEDPAATKGPAKHDSRADEESHSSEAHQPPAAAPRT